MNSQISLGIDDAAAPPRSTLRTSLLLSASAILLSIPCGVMAQAPPPPVSSASYVDGLAISAQSGQGSDQQVADRTACESWSKDQTGFDITQPNGGVSPGDYTSRREQFNRAMTACLQARGYLVRVAMPPAGPSSAPPPRGFPPPPPPAPVYGARYASTAAPTLQYKPVKVSVGGGFSLTTGAMDSNFDDGGIGTLGVSFFPAASVPLGIRVDGNYSWYGARDRYLREANADIGHQEIYGGDADLQLNLGPPNARSQFYLLGGAGWYRERTTVHQVSGFDDFCDDFYCGGGGLYITATARETTQWRDSWNAGFGWEWAVSNYGSLFVEARYRSIGPNNDKEAFVPVQIGFRF
jgi:Outer membrane protein beta-barrel domain